MGIIFRKCCGLAFTCVFALLSWGIGDPHQVLAEDDRTDDFPKITLKTQDGKEVEFYNDLVKDKVVIINFMYTECNGLCEQATKKLAQVQKALGERLGREVFIYSITLDPEHDTPEVLKKYAEAHGAKPGWTFLTADARDVAKLRDSLGLAERTPASSAQLGLPIADSDAEAGQRKHTGMIAIGYFGDWHNTPIGSSREQILQVIGRMKPPSSPQK